MEDKSAKKEKEATVGAKKNAFKWQDYLIANFKTVIGLTAFLIIAAGYFFILKPKYEDISRLILEAQGHENEKSSLMSQLERLERAKKQYEEIDPEDLDKVDKILPLKPGKDELLSQLESLILRNGLLLTSLLVEETKEARQAAPADDESSAAGDGRASEASLSADIGKIRIVMEIAGTDYENLKKILAVIENNVRLLDVTKISFSPDGKKTSLDMQAYYLKNAK